MSMFFTRTMFAGASVALTVAMVAASASAAVVAPVHQTQVQIGDLNLTSAAGQKTLERRLNAAADTVCPANGVIVDTHCRADAIAHARAAIGQKAAEVTTGATSS